MYVLAGTAIIIIINKWWWGERCSPLGESNSCVFSAAKTLGINGKLHIQKNPNIFVIIIKNNPTRLKATLSAKRIYVYIYYFIRFISYIFEYVCVCVTIGTRGESLPRKYNNIITTTLTPCSYVRTRIQR